MSGIRHEAWLYSGVDEFVSGSLTFVEEGLEAGEDVMVATTPAHLAGLRDELQDDAGQLALLDMSQAGRNPGRILSIWRRFADLANSRGRAARGIGEPVWPERTAEELDECRRHEALINTAFGSHADFWLLCPYDRSALDERALASAESTHPTVYQAGAPRRSRSFDHTLGDRALDGELPPPPPTAERRRFDPETLGALRTFARTIAVGAGFGPDRADDLVFAVNELAANAIRHGGRRGSLTVWRTRPDALVCEVEDEGRIRDPLVGRREPPAEELNGRGLWIAHELCDLVQVRSAEEGTRVRVALSACR
jgi:anti-sigma regulatory factor (Ser/Thr protein kinase)